MIHQWRLLSGISVAAWLCRSWTRVQRSRRLAGVSSLHSLLRFPFEFGAGLRHGAVKQDAESTQPVYCTDTSQLACMQGLLWDSTQRCGHREHQTWFRSRVRPVLALLAWLQSHCVAKVGVPHVCAQVITPDLAGLQSHLCWQILF